MSCAWQNRLTLYSDGELSPAETAQCEDHLRSCTSCAAEALALIQAKRLVRSAAASAFSPRADLRSKIAASLQPRRSKWRALWPQLAFAGALAIAIFAATVIFSRRPPQRGLLAELIDVHTSTLASANPVDVISTDRHTVKPWFEGKLPFTFNLPEMHNSEFQLLGGKLVYVEQRPAAYLLFSAGKHRISVFIFQNGPANQTANLKSSTPDGFSAETWDANGLRYLALSDASPQTVESLSSLLRSAQTENAGP